ncbi:MAG TPA: hypothetical protein DCZ95_00850 [Verrucomicrobia bacterium]|nr:MAG: hypothetical protein A2X46_16755 [Lentisphaerae bacterium GWF2_57_35]HBA82616.1 hypothetical protein [Verrucomicrobiota bacterium]
MYPSPGAATCEDWLLDVANVRGADFVTRHPPRDPNFQAPAEKDLSNEELVVAICRTDRLDRPQMLRAAAQLVSRNLVSAEKLIFMAHRERTELVLAELARQALHVKPPHLVWAAISDQLGNTPTPRSPILHWTRLALPIPDARGINAVGWRLIA